MDVAEAEPFKQPAVQHAARKAGRAPVHLQDLFANVVVSVGQVGGEAFAVQADAVGRRPGRDETLRSPVEDGQLPAARTSEFRANLQLEIVVGLYEDGIAGSDDIRHVFFRSDEDPVVAGMIQRLAVKEDVRHQSSHLPNVSNGLRGSQERGRAAGFAVPSAMNEASGHVHVQRRVAFEVDPVDFNLEW